MSMVCQVCRFPRGGNRKSELGGHMSQLEDLLESMRRVQAGADAVAVAHEFIRAYQGQRFAALGPQERRRRIRELWRAGATVERIAAVVGCTKTWVREVLRERGA